MDESLVFKHGQVWYWSDPIYGRKSEKLKVDQGEVTQRYSRYVLIVQGIINVNDDIMCIPLSSSRHDESDVEIQIMIKNKKSTSYAMLTKIFVASSMSLRRYICTLPRVNMIDIRNSIHDLLIPNPNKKKHNNAVNTRKSTAGFRGDYNEYLTNVGVQHNNVNIAPTKIHNRRRNNWTDINNKIKFIEAFEKYNIKDLANMYNLSESSCEDYYRTFKRYIKNMKKNKNKK